MPCLIEARYAGEGDDAIPADRIVIGLHDSSLTGNEQKFRTVNQLRTDLWLRPGRYRVRVSGADGQIVNTQNITVASTKERTS